MYLTFPVLYCGERNGSSIEDIQYHLYVLEKIRKGQEDIADGRHFTHEEARERLRKWLNP